MRLTVGFRDGATPDPHSVLSVQADLVRLYALLGEEMAGKFAGKERRYLERKIEHAKQYVKGRLDTQKRVSAADAEHNAFLAVGDEYGREIDAMEEYELYRVMLKSLQNAFDFSRSVVSFLKTSEASPSNQ